MDTSILNDIKVMLGITVDTTAFDAEIIIHINSALTSIYQLGVSETPLYIHDSATIWTSLLGIFKDIELVKSLVYLKVKLLFDPPSQYLVELIQRQITEFEERIIIQIESR